MTELDYIEASDGGDGSTFITVHFKDGKTWVVNPDLPYDGKVHCYPNGREETYMQNGDSGPPNYESKWELESAYGPERPS